MENINLEKKIEALEEKNKELVNQVESLKTVVDNIKDSISQIVGIVNKHDARFNQFVYDLAIRK